MASGIYRPKYAPKGMTWQEAKAAGQLRESETYWIRYWQGYRMVRESSESTRYEDAKKLLNQRRRAVDRQEPINPKANRVTVAEMAERLRALYEEKGQDVPTLMSRLRHLLAAFGPRRMSSLTPDDIAQYKTARLAAPPRHRRRAERTANATINRELELLARAFTLGQELGLLTVTLPVRRQRMAEAKPREGFFEDHQYEAVRQHLPVDLQVALAIEHAFGWRTQSEVLPLERRHLDLEAGTLRLDPGSTKNDEARVVYLTTELIALLGEQLARVETLQRQLGRIVPYLFPHLTGRLRGQRIKDFRRRWKTACRRAGVPGRLRHDFRRTAVRNLVNANVPERVAMQITGHKTRSVFDRYHIVAPEDLKAAALKLMTHRGSKVSSKVSSKTHL
jgi:integrase